MQIEATIRDMVQTALKELGIEETEVLLEHPADLSHGDYSTNVAMILAKREGKNPSELATSIAEKIQELYLKDPVRDIDKISVAGPGFINFFLSRQFFAESIGDILKADDNWGKNDHQKGQKIMVEFTDPNPFKAFHIGHLMSNTIGESISRLIEFSGAEVKRATYQGDVGPHVAKAIWGLQNGKGNTESSEGLGVAYAAGENAYEDNQEEIDRINRAVYEGSDPEVNKLYEKGRQVSLDHFEIIYKKLGTAFDFNFFEGGTWYEGTELVKKHTGTVFEESEGAVVFKGEKYDKKLHTRVFINSKGLPTYEAKELGLPYAKYEKYPFDRSISITAQEQETYFAVVIKAIEQFDPELAAKIEHISHGFMKLSTGKMSSRKGDVVTGESLLSDVVYRVEEVMKDRDIEDKEEVAEAVAVSAIKYSILKQNPGKDIAYDVEKSLSFDGDSGPYLQYARTRAHSVLLKANKGSIDIKELPRETTVVEQLLYRFPSVVEKAQRTYEPHHITTYLTELAGAFNSFYASTKIIDGEHEGYFLGLTKAFRNTMKQGLHLLGIKAPDKM